MSGYGPTGPQGPRGIQGVKGDQGIQGQTGLQGPGGGGGASLTSTSNIVITAPSGVGINTTPAYTLDLNGGSLGNVNSLNVSKASNVGPVVVNNATAGVDYTITTSGSKTFYNFKTVRAAGATQMSITTTSDLVVDYLAIGGGGGGGGSIAGGGGAGGLQQASGFTLTPATRTITIGAGGPGGSKATNSTGTGGTNGDATTFGSSFVTAAGGGGGGSFQGVAAKSGGCGGGGSDSLLGGTGTQGRAGAPADLQRFGGGGGGVGAVTPTGAVGGIGITYNNGTVLELGGGGGGGPNASRTGGVGSFGGGNGGDSGGAGTGVATSGTAGTGGGGGGGRYSPSAAELAGSGGSGIFILAFNTADIAPGAPLTFASASIDASFNMVLSATSNIRLTATNVGINVTQPTVALDVAGQIRGRVVLSNWAGPTGAVDFTSSTGNSIYNYITNTGFNALTLGNPGSGYVGSYSVIKNNTTTGLSIALTYATGATGPTSPLILYSSNAATLIWSGPTGGYIQF